MQKKGIYQTSIKRVLDIIISGSAIIVLLPLFFLLMILIRFKLGSPVLFKQDRPGKDGRIFTLYKFRSMTNERDKSGCELSDEDRLTSFGRKLRATSLDELPELWNILKGDMSIVGPRPLLVEYLPKYNEIQQHRHDVRPGVTGLAQVNGRNAISWKEKFEYDIKYVNNISFAVDMKIILKTFYVVFAHRGINSDTSVTMEKFRGNE